MNNYHYIFFDGECGFCNRAVIFVLHRLRSKEQVRFAPLSGSTARKVLQSRPSGDTMIYFDGSRSHTHSDAALKVTQLLKAPWPILSVFLVVPRLFRDLIYRGIAKRRYLLGDPVCKILESHERAVFCD